MFKLILASVLKKLKMRYIITQFEADHMIAHVCRSLTQQGIRAYAYTRDRDLTMLGVDVIERLGPNL